MAEHRDQGRNQCIDGIQLYFSKHYCQTKGRVTEPDHLPTPFQTASPHTLPELAAGPMENYSSVCQATEQGTETHPADKGEYIEERQLKFDSQHY